MANKNEINYSSKDSCSGSLAICESLVPCRSFEASVANRDIPKLEHRKLSS